MTARDDFTATERATAGQIPPRLFVFARHAESTANASRLVSSDPHHPVALTDRGRQQARGLGAQVAGLDIELAVATRFRRTQETAALAVSRRPVPLLIEPGLDEIQAGDLDGSPLEDYWSWKDGHASTERFPNGESVDEARIRYAAALRRLLSRAERVMLIVVHELSLRWIAETATGSPLPPDAFDNATVYLFGERAVEQAAARLEKIATVAGGSLRRVPEETPDTRGPVLK
jgi:broad specificity phosphatase PhoE